MSVYGFVIALLLLFPWVLVGVVIVGATSSAVKNRLEFLHRTWRVRRRGESVLSPPQVRNREHPAGRRAADQSSVPQSGVSMRKAA